MRVIIDKYAGFCPGVEQAIAQAEQFLANHDELVSIGPIIHNPIEVDRLAKIGLRTIEQEQLSALGIEAFKESTALIRTHGVSEELRKYLESHFHAVRDATCPIVKAVQERVAEYCQQGYQIIIVGKKEHPEVQGLIGHCPHGAKVVQSIAEINGFIAYNKKSVVFAQTTISQNLFNSVCSYLKEQMPTLICKDTTCNVVSNRHEKVSVFAGSTDVIVFVGGKNSSNSKMLFSVCKGVNERSYWIEDTDGIDDNWFKDVELVGITGGASTPKWLLEKVKEYIEKIARPRE